LRNCATDPASHAANAAVMIRIMFQEMDMAWDLARAEEMLKYEKP
jgi:hypothetical protein